MSGWIWVAIIAVVVVIVGGVIVGRRKSHSS